MYLCRCRDHSWKLWVSLQLCEGHLFCAERATAVHERSSSLSALHTSVTQLPPDISITQYHELWRSSSCMIFFMFFFCHPQQHPANSNVLILKQCVRLRRLMPKVFQPAWLAYLFGQLKTSSDAGTANTRWHLGICFEFLDHANSLNSRRILLERDRVKKEVRRDRQTKRQRQRSS